MKISIISISLFAAALTFAACGTKHTEGDGHDHSSEAKTEEEDAHGHGEHAEHENLATVSLSAEQLKAVKIQIGGIERKQLTAALKLNGVLKVPNENMAQVTSLYPGVVKTLYVQAGSKVKKGQAIATIANPQYIQLQEEYLTLLGKITYSEQEETRQKDLNTGNAGALKNLQAVQSELRSMRTRKASLHKQLQGMGIDPDKVSEQNLATVLTVVSPISGAVSRVLANIGTNVDFATPLAEVVDNSQLHLDLFVFEKDLPKMKVGQTIHFTLTNNPGKEYDALIFGIGSTFEPNTKNVAVHAKVKGNQGELIDGMNITALVSLEKAMLDAVPTDAIVNHEGQDFIFIVTDAHAETEHHDEASEGEKGHDEAGHQHEEEKEAEKPAEGSLMFEKIPVRKGTTDVGYSEITLLRDIPKGAKVVTAGAFFVLAKMTNQGEGHAH